MNLRLYAAFMLFLGSYLPLSFILLAQNFEYEYLFGRFCVPFEVKACHVPIHQPIISLVFFAICLFCFFFTIVTLSKIKTRQEKIITEAKSIPADLMNYVLPYIVSFMGLDYDDRGKLVGFVIFLLWIFVITHKSERIIMNPVLAVFGWKLYDVVSQSPGGDKGSPTVALSRVYLTPGVTYKVNAVQEVLVIK